MSRGDDDHPLRRLMDRRRALGVLGALGLGAIAAACSRKPTTTGAGASPTAGSSPSPAGSSGGTNPDCVLTPELTEGPYYIDLDPVRSDIREDRPGAVTRLAITVVDAATCNPVKDAAVDIWHADAGGEYSGFGSAGGGGPGGGGAGSPTNDKRFLRGTQITDANGVATFTTVYPGWYPGRAVHIHVKVHNGGRDVHTGQLFFTDGFTDAVYRKAPYSARPTPDIRNTQDGIFAQSQGSGLVNIVASGDGYDGSITLGVKTA